MKVQFRGKCKHTGLYVTGNLFENSKGRFIIENDSYNKNLDEFDNIKVFTPIEFDTLSISFEDMIDSKGNKIFASLSEDGKGGDICETITFSYNKLQKAKVLKHAILLDILSLTTKIVSNVSCYNNPDIEYLIKNSRKDIKVVGIQK